MPNNIEQSKPKRLQKIEAAYEDRHVVVDFEESDVGYWIVYMKGHFAGFELHEITKALKAATKAGRL